MDLSGPEIELSSCSCRILCVRVELMIKRLLHLNPTFCVQADQIQLGLIKILTLLALKLLSMAISLFYFHHLTGVIFAELNFKTFEGSAIQMILCLSLKQSKDSASGCYCKNQLKPSAVLIKRIF